MNATPSQIALSRLRSKKVIPIIGARRVTQLQGNLKCVDLLLDDPQSAELDKVSKIQLGFPHDFYCCITSL